MRGLPELIAANESWGQEPPAPVAPDLAAEPYLVAVVSNDGQPTYYVHPDQKSIVYDAAVARGFATSGYAAFWASNNRDRLLDRPSGTSVICGQEVHFSGQTLAVHERALACIGRRLRHPGNGRVSCNCPVGPSPLRGGYAAFVSDF